MRVSAWILPAILLLLFAAALWGDMFPKPGRNEVSAAPLQGAQASGPLYVLVHGFAPRPKRWNAIASVLKPHGAVLSLTYDAHPSSNADPELVARNIGARLEEALRQNDRDIVVVAHSMGALLARRAILQGLEDGKPWTQRVRRLVLLAGMNRGWTVEGERAPDAPLWLEVQLRIGIWLARMIGRGQLVLGMERGAPFVSDLRLSWMQTMQKLAKDATRSRSIEVVQLLGDIDDFVHREDNEDLRASAVGRFALVRVRGTGHADIIQFNHDSHDTDAAALGRYRQSKLILAATAPFEEVLTHNEELPPPVNDNVRDIVFVLHGIRDLGRWSSQFETDLRARYPQRADNLLMVSPRYGYLGMGPFLFESVRRRYVRWFMDEYTETLARYPQVKPENIRFFGHSNGTYLLADALQQYRSMRVGHVVLAGTVVRSGYPWSGLGERVGAIRNYVGTHDWVVALFPRFFDLPGVRALRNPLGGGGFHGFDDCKVQNVMVAGAHGAFDGHEQEILDFLMAAPAAIAPAAAACEGKKAGWKEARSIAAKLLGTIPVVLATWAFLVALVAYIGWRVVGAAAAPNWPMLLVFALLVITVLRTV
ncbi:MAG TPA: alpha/beta hydrolase [Ramlibacter sp.]|jgi:pimeloyl-ACP methyl ester carboxylesterase|nr:alpha/beta hydrolase [Ramlibacter sp.]